MNQRSPSSQLSFAARVANAVAFALIVLPPLDVLFAVLPLRIGQLRWRVATIGLISGYLMMPMLGFLIGLTAAHLRERRTLARFYAIASSLIGIAVLVAAVLFTLDTVQLRPEISLETKRAYDIA